MYAVIETGGKQYRVELGTELEVDLLDAEPGQSVTLDRVLLVADGDDTAIGRPLVEGATVDAEVVRRDRGEKLIVFKYRPKARRRVKKGHRQSLTVLRVTDLRIAGRSAAEDARKQEQAAKTERERLEEAAARQAAEDAALAAKLAKRAGPAAGEADATPKRASTRKPTVKADEPAAPKKGSTSARTGRASTAPKATAADPAGAAPKPTRARGSAKPPAGTDTPDDKPKRGRARKSESE
jgi:large subunit ribosomal protein L21